MPLRFFNAFPPDWSEGANDGHRYELRFEQPPTSAQVAAIANCFERTLASGPANPAEKEWLWSGPFALFWIGERWLKSRPAFSQVWELAKAIDRIAPLQHAAHLGARETNYWPPGPVPPPGLDGRKVEPSWPELAPNSDFEEARKAARAAVAHERAFKGAQNSGLELVPLEQSQDGDQEQQRDWGALNVPSPRSEQRPQGKYTTLWLFDGDHPLLESARPCARVFKDNKPKGIAFLDDDGSRREVTGLPENPYYLVVEVHGSGGHALALVGRHIYHVDFTTSAARLAWVSDAGAVSVAALGDLWAVRNAADIYVFDFTQDKPEPLAQLRKKGGWSGMASSLATVVPGAVLAAGHFRKDMSFIGYHEGKLKALATLKGEYSGRSALEDGMIVIDTAMTRERFAVRGVEELFLNWVKLKPAKAKPKTLTEEAPSKGKTASKKLRIALAPLEMTEVPEAERSAYQLSEADWDFLRPRIEAGSTPPHQFSRHGLLAALVGGSSQWVKTLAWRPTKGEWRELPMPKQVIRPYLSLDPGGLLAVVDDTRTFQWFDLAAQTCATVDVGSDHSKRVDVNSSGVRAASADDVLHWLGTTVRWFTRRDAEFVRVGEVNVPGFVRAVAEPHLRLLFAFSKAKNRLVVYRQREDKLIKLGAFTERLDEVRFREGRVFLIASYDQKAYELLNAADA
ncbi:MAG: hypothetical protein R3B89_25010 [Polyangiaceae bacterium]